MNTVWSTYVQNIGTLYRSRSMRFSDAFQTKYTDFFGLPDGGNILEIGCGPGALAESLHRWYPDARITGIDRDSNFIDFASKRSPEITFLEGDATNLPFADGSFDVTISNTVAEHIEPAKFYGEQYRVLKEGGICLVLYARKGVSIPAPCIAEETAFEQEIWQKAHPAFMEAREKYAVCAYPQNEAELPLNMEKYGFRNVTTEYLTVNLTPDNPIYPAQMAHGMINANRQNDLDNIDSLLRLAGHLITAEEAEELRRLVNARYDRRIALYDRGIPQWDTDLSLTMVVRGIK